MSKHQITVSRLHKLAERLVSAASEVSSAATQHLNGVAVNSALSETSKARVVAESEKQNSAIASYLSLVDDIQNIKTVIAVKNAELGISAMMVAQDAAQKKLNFVKGILNTNRTQQVEVSEVNAQFENKGATRGIYDGVVVLTLEKNKESVLEGLKENLQKQVNNFSDEIADLNRQKVEVELSASAVKVLGL